MTRYLLLKKSPMNNNNLDILAFGAHPDDAEIFMGGSLLYFKSLALSVGVCDLTQGELSTYGDKKSRKKEREAASKILKLDVRETLDIPDGQVLVNKKNLTKVINVIRSHCPKIIFTMPPNARHPDHGHTHHLVKEAFFLSGLKKWPSPKSPYRAMGFAYYPEWRETKKPDFVVDITDFVEQKRTAIEAYRSQVLKKNEENLEIKTFVRSSDFWRQLEVRSVLAGSFIGVQYGEPFFSPQSLALTQPLDQLVKKGMF